MPIDDHKRKVVLVTGSRDWTDRDAVWSVLEDECPDIIIHGACPTGADSIAADYASDGYNTTSDIPMPAQWDNLGKRAGPVRNSGMVDVLRGLRLAGHDCVVVAFPLGKSFGTRDCMRKAKSAGFVVYDHDPGAHIMSERPGLRCPCGVLAVKRCGLVLAPELISLGGVPGEQECKAGRGAPCDCPVHRPRGWSL